MPKLRSAAVAEEGNVHAINESEGPVVVKVAIPSDVYQLYETIAAGQDLTVSELMSHRLQRCATHSSIRSIYFPESQLRQLEQVLQVRPIESSEHALVLITNAFKFRIDTFEPIVVSATQAKRLHLGAYAGFTVQEHLNRIIQGAVAKATGV